jgi:hypothetical protein
MLLIGFAGIDFVSYRRSGKSTAIKAATRDQ